MNEQLISEVVAELSPLLAGRPWGKIFQLSRASLAVDFRTGDGRYLFVSASPGDPRLHMIARSVRELEKSSGTPSGFALALRKHLGGATLRAVSKDPGERVVRFSFDARGEAGDERFPVLVVQLTGRSSNLFLLDERGRVLDSLRPARGAGQEAGEVYAPPSQVHAGAASDETIDVVSDEASDENVSAVAPPEKSPRRVASIRVASSEAVIKRGSFDSLSDALDDFHRRRERERAFDARRNATAARLRQAVEKRQKLRRNLERDRAAHGDADEHKKIGDLLLANIANAERRGPVVRLADYYAEGAPIIEVEVDENKSLQEEAGARFARYTKARRAAGEIERRLETLTRELAALEALRPRLQAIEQARDASALEELEALDGELRVLTGEAAPRKEEARARPGQKKPETIPGVRRYRSSDGYEVLVGRAARDNEHLTFRVARPHDLWLHAADYPGSHVVVRNHKRGQEVPHRTVIEAARLAAHFSQAREDAKVAVHHTERKFVSKIKGAAPGLVRLSSFRTLLVEPGEELERV